jgi:predicted nucleotidyltransferase
MPAGRGVFVHPELERAIEELEISQHVVALRDAAAFSRGVVVESQGFLRARIDAALPVDILVLGSVAREEGTAASDLDYVVVMHALLEDPASGVREVVEAMEELRRDRLDLGDPGQTGLFGRLIAAQDLVERIGLQDDSNENHTRRILLLTESRPLLSSDLYHRLLRAVIRRYLADYTEPKEGVPRFLLNDVLRYWRTLAIDYQAKLWGQPQPEWGLRYLKLIISRKLMIAGTLTSLFLCERATEDYFVEQFQMPALARLAQVRAVADAPQRDAVASALVIASEFVEALKDEDFRDEAKAVRTRNDIDPGSRFGAMQQSARVLQQYLETIFFDTPALSTKSRKYLSF